MFQIGLTGFIMKTALLRIGSESMKTKTMNNKSMKTKNIEEGREKDHSRHGHLFSGVSLAIICFMLLLAGESMASGHTVNLISPKNNTTTNLNNNSLQFVYNHTGSLTGVVNCTLYLDGNPVNYSTDVPANTSQSVYSNQSWSEGSHYWYVNCTNGISQESSLDIGQNYTFTFTPPVKGVISVAKDGTADFKRINLALYFSEPGDIIEIQDSETYPEDLNLEPFPNRTIRAKEGEHPIIYGRIRMGTNCVLDGLRITYPFDTEKYGGSATTIVAHRGGWTIKNCDIYDIPYNSAAISMASTVENAKIINNRIHDGKGQALAICCNYDKGNILIANNVFYNLWMVDIRSDTTNNTIISNTFYKVPISIQSDTTVFKNNIVVSSTFESAGPVSYNCFYDSADITTNGNIVANPLFADPDNGDFHLRSEAGRWNGTGWVNDTNTSPCIDAGDPSSNYSNEPNGNRINMGAYGNTNYASKSTGTVNTAPPSPQVSISPSSPTQNDNLTCNIDNQPPDPDGDNITYIYRWYKNTLLQDDLTNSTVPSSYVEEGDLWQCEVMANDGSLNSVPATAEVRVQGNISRPDYQDLKTQYCWLQAQIDALPSEGGVVNIPEGEHTIAITFIDRSNITLQGQGPDKTILKPYAESGDMIKIGNNFDAPSNITVKNLSIDGLNRDILGVEVGTGVSNSSIKDIIIKNVSNGIVLVRTNKITLDNCICHISGGTSILYVHSSNCTIRDCETSGGDYGIDLNSGNKNFMLENNYIHNSGVAGLDIYSGSDNTTVRNNLFEKNYRRAIWLFGGENSKIINNTIRMNNGNGIDINAIYGNDKSVIKNNMIYNNTGTGIHGENERGGESETYYIESNTIFGNGGDGIYNHKLENKNIIVENNIIVNNNGYGLRNNISSSTITSSYNDVWSNTLGNYNGTSAGTGDISEDPLFADPDNGDFHLKSQAGRWNGTDWVNDNETSPCIDAGDPSEKDPDGTRINMGAYGGTWEASKSPGAATGTLTGNVTDKDTGLPIEGALIKANSHQTTTNSTGGYIITLPVGNYMVTASKTGYYPNSTTVQVLENQTTIVDFQLTTISFSITLNSPPNQTTTNDPTPDFNFTVSGSSATYNCTLFINNTNYGTNSSTLNNTPTIITANSSLSDGTYNWYINCSSGENTTQSEVREITITTPTTTTTTSTSTIPGTTTTTSTSTTTTTTTTTIWPCDLPGDYPTCGEVTLEEVVDFINLWAGGQADLGDVVNLINAWAEGPVCELPGDYPPCGEITLEEVVDFINLWSLGQADLEDVVNLINAWAGS